MAEQSLTIPTSAVTPGVSQAIGSEASGSPDLTDLSDAFRQRLRHNQAAWIYLRSRVHDVEGVVDLLQVGVSPPQWGRFPVFSQRLTVPVWVGNVVVGFRGRAFLPGDSRPKAVPWPTNPSPIPWPMGLGPSTVAEIQREGFCVVVEGEFDAMALWAAGIPAVATLKTRISMEQALYLSAVVDCALVWADSDPVKRGHRAGQEGAYKTGNLLEAYGVQVGYYADPVVKDAADFAWDHGAEELRRVVSYAVERAAAGLSQV